MDDRRFALIIYSSDYSDSELRKLTAPAGDADDLARILGDPAIGGFEVRTLANEPSHRLNQEIESFFDNRKRGDLLLLYFSGHGIKDADGQLYFAAADTRLENHNVRRATAVSARFVNEAMSQSRSRRQVLLLDCCYAGAFKEGMLTKSDVRVGVGDHLQGQGRVILAGSDALQYSFEGGNIAGQPTRSVFTRIVIEGLQSGRADIDRDGFFSVDDLYSYAHEQMAEECPGQKPVKMGFVEGEIFIGRNPKPFAGELPKELKESIQNPERLVRLGAIQELRILLRHENQGIALAALQALQLLTQDDSVRVAQMAKECLAEQAQFGAKEYIDLPESNIRSVGGRQSVAAERAEVQITSSAASDRSQSRPTAFTKLLGADALRGYAAALLTRRRTALAAIFVGFILLFLALWLRRPVVSPTTDESQSGSIIGSADSETGDLHADILELKRKASGTVTLKVAFVNNKSQFLSLLGFFSRADFGGVSLVDLSNKKYYFEMRDSQGACLCSRDVPDLNPGARVILYATFPAPPDNVTKINIEIPHFPPIEDVPISS